MAAEELQDAVIRNVEVIGEAARRVSAETRARLAGLDWRANNWSLPARIGMHHPARHFRSVDSP